MKVTLVIPVLNEIVGMKAIMPQIKREWVDQILFIDGQSTDGTLEWIKQNIPLRSEHFFSHARSLNGGAPRQNPHPPRRNHYMLKRPRSAGSDFGVSPAI